MWRFREFSAAIANLKTDLVVLDGEVAVFDVKLVSRFRLLSDDSSGDRPGRRRSEACAVQWPDFDAMGQTLRVERAVTDSGRVKEIKTGEAREVDLTPRVLAAFSAFQVELGAEARELSGSTTCGTRTPRTSSRSERTSLTSPGSSATRR